MDEQDTKNLLDANANLKKANANLTKIAIQVDQLLLLNEELQRRLSKIQSVAMYILQHQHHLDKKMIADQVHQILHITHGKFS